MKRPPKRGQLVKHLSTGKEGLRNGIVLEPWAEAPLDRVWVHWPGDGEQVWAEKITDLALEPLAPKKFHKLLQELFKYDIFDGEYGECRFCDAYLSHTEDCGWVAVAQAAGIEIETSKEPVKDTCVSITFPKITSPWAL